MKMSFSYTMMILRYRHNNGARNSIDPIKYRFPVDGTLSSWCVFFWPIFLAAVACVDWVLTRTAWSHYNFAIWLNFDGRFQRKNIISWIESIEVQKRTCRTYENTIYPFFSLGTKFRMLHECVIYDYFRMLLKFQRTSNVKLANKFVCVSFIYSVLSFIRFSTLFFLSFVSCVG